MWPDAFSAILLFLDASNTHPDQLTLAEFAAIRTRRLVQHLDMMAVARTVRLTQDDATHGRDTHEDDRFNADPKAKIYESEFVGGEHDLEEQEAAVAEEDLVQNTPGLHARVTLSVARDILRRDEEIAAAKKPGRHRDSDQQMKAFADRFGDRLSAPLPALLTEQRFERPQLLGASATVALAHQQAVRSAMKKEQQDLQTNEQNAGDEKSLQAMLTALENLRQHDAEATCTIQELPDLMRGPKHVAERIMREQACHDPPHVLNDEQMTLYALWVDAMQQAFTRRSNPEEPFLPLDEWLFDIIIDGGGGCGKTMLINHFFVPLCRAFFRHAGVVLAAPTNKAARGIHAKTLHCVLGFTPESSLRTSALALTTQRRVKLERTCIPAGAVIEDEFSMIAGSMNHAASLLFTYAREGTYRLRREDYAQPRERYGRVAILAWAGDHLQLPPVPKKNSLLAPLQSTSQEHRVGASIFRNAQYVFQMRQMMRFKDARLLRILQTMRTVGGQALSPTDWKALLDTEANEQGCSVAQPTPPQGWYHTCYVWSIIAMASYVDARDSARLAQKTLFYVQAVDVITNYSASCPEQSRDLFRSLLQVPSLTKTKRLPAFCLLHVGMEVRLTTTLDQPYAVQDATATVLEIHYAEHDAAAQQYMRSAAQPEEVLLDQLPVAVLVRLHDCKHVFLPCEPCDGCEAFNSLCEKCGDKRKDLEGIFAVQPIPRSWTYDGPELKGQYVNVARRQLPLGPARVLPLYSMQGMTAEPGLVAHWTFPPRLDYDIKWLIGYVILSRVPSLPQLMSIGLSDKIRAIIEGGPPDSLVQAFNTLFQDKAEQTLAAALEARRRLGW